jgi:hypothetical protein
MSLNDYLKGSWKDVEVALERAIKMKEKYALQKSMMLQEHLPTIAQVIVYEHKLAHLISQCQGFQPP